MSDNNIVEKLLTDLGEKAKEIEKIYNLLKSLKEYDESIEIPDIATLIGSGCTEIANSSGSSIRPDEFYGLSYTDATERYLKKMGHAMSLDDIYDTLMKGGIVFTGNGRNTLNIMLTRATRKFAKIISDSVIHFGLLEWYPARKSKTKVLIEQTDTTLEDIAVAIEEKEMSAKENEGTDKKEKGE